MINKIKDWLKERSEKSKHQFETSLGGIIAYRLKDNKFYALGDIVPLFINNREMNVQIKEFKSDMINVRVNMCFGEQKTPIPNLPPTQIEINKLHPAIEEN